MLYSNGIDFVPARRGGMGGATCVARRPSPPLAPPRPLATPRRPAPSPPRPLATPHLAAPPRPLASVVGEEDGHALARGTDALALAAAVLVNLAAAHTHFLVVCPGGQVPHALFALWHMLSCAGSHLDSLRGPRTTPLRIWIHWTPVAGLGCLRC